MVILVAIEADGNDDGSGENDGSGCIGYGGTQASGA